MATFTGHDGVLKFADTSTDGAGALSMTDIGNLRNFTIEQSQDTIETTVMGTTSSTGSYRTYKPGLSTFTISGDVFYDGLAASTVQQKLDEMVSRGGDEGAATFECYPAGETTGIGNTKLTGECIITSFSITSSVDGMVEASFSAQGTGALTVVELT
jgi:hypothetical protein